MVSIRANPYPPNFSRIAASTIDPAIGASTCALGNQRCTVNMGSLTKNPARAIIQKKEFSLMYWGKINSDLNDMSMLLEE